MADGSSEPLDPSSAAPGRAARPRVALVALGCRVNRADVDALAAELQDRFDIAREGEAADLVVVNTCSITGDAEATARQAIRRAAREHPRARIVAAGCYAEVRPDALESLPGVAAVVGARSQGAVAGVVTRLALAGGPHLPLRGGFGPPEPPVLAPGQPHSAAPALGVQLLTDAAADATSRAAFWGAAAIAPARHTRPFLKVQDGCDRRCAYCIVPLARGASRSLALEEALRRLALLGARHAEVVLTGIHLGAYGKDLAPRASLAALVREAVRARLVRRLRLSSIEPGELPREILLERDVAAGLCEHFHLPLQSGSARVLAAMRRPHGAAEFRRAIADVSAHVPGACLGTDVLVGFPGETDEDHRETVALVESLPLAYLHVFPFWPRPGTPAADMDGAAPKAVVRERVRELRAISDRKWRGYLAAQVGRELEVVVERVAGGVARGTADRYVTVRWPASREARGDVARVRIEASDGEACVGVRA